LFLWVSHRFVAPLRRLPNRVKPLPVLSKDFFDLATDSLDVPSTLKAGDPDVVPHTVADAIPALTGAEDVTTVLFTNNGRTVWSKAEVFDVFLLFDLGSTGIGRDV
jgi:hypothetical protein